MREKLVFIAVMAALISLFYWIVWGLIFAGILFLIPARAKAEYVKAREPSSALSLKAMQTIGRELFRDPIMSVDRKMTCTTCHDPDAKKGYSDGRKVAVGRIGSTVPVGAIAGGRGVAADGLIGIRRTRSLINCYQLLDKPSNCDGRAFGIYQSCLQACTDPLVMGYNNVGEVLSAINQVPRYLDLSITAFGTVGMTEHDLRSALVHYLCTIRSDDTPADQLYAASRSMSVIVQGPQYFGEKPPGYEKALERLRAEQEAKQLAEKTGAPANVVRGFQLFMSHCASCHDPEQGWRNHDAHRTGLVYRWAFFPENRGKTPDRIRGAIRGSDSNFKAMTQSVIDAARHPPYGYNGSVEDLPTAVNYFCHGGRFRYGDQILQDPGIDPEIAKIDMTKEQEFDVLAFLTLACQSEQAP